MPVLSDNQLHGLGSGNHFGSRCQPHVKSISHLMSYYPLRSDSKLIKCGSDRDGNIKVM